MTTYCITSSHDSTIVTVSDGEIADADPRLAFLIGWRLARVVKWCQSKGWKIECLKQ